MVGIARQALSGDELVGWILTAMAWRSPQEELTWPVRARHFSSTTDELNLGSMRALIHDHDRRSSSAWRAQGWSGLKTVLARSAPRAQRAVRSVMIGPTRQDPRMGFASRTTLAGNAIIIAAEAKPCWDRRRRLEAH
jgi:hypothetical protein